MRIKRESYSTVRVRRERKKITSQPSSSRKTFDSEESQCIEKLNKEYDKYYVTVRLTLALKKALEKYNIENIQFHQTEYNLQSVHDSKKVTPDVAWEESSGELILFEIKSSFPFTHELLKRELLDLKKYDADLIRLDQRDIISENHEFVLLCPLIDYEAVSNGINNLGSAIAFSHHFSIWTWSEVDALRSGSTNSIVIERKRGEMSDSILNSVSKHIHIDALDLIEESERFIFVPAPPPDVYLIERIFNQIFPGIFPQKEKVFISFEEIVRIAKSYYIAWPEDQRTTSQIRSGWIRRGLDILEELSLAEKNSEGEYYVQSWLGRRTKNLREYIIKELCKRELGKREVEEEEERKKLVAEKQQKLDEFLVQNRSSSIEEEEK
ncbi:MAG: hypothetical protein ACFE9L_11305 [Candidatus Hodarchaeota archaeon]